MSVAVETLIDCSPRVELVSEVRSTLLSSSLGSLRARGLFDTYTRQLPEAFHEAVLRTLAPTWLPVEAAIAHYEAVEALGLSRSESIAMGKDVGTRLQSGVLGMLARTYRGAGLTPWPPLKQAERLWGRVARGGGVAIRRVAAKDARIELHGFPLARIEYVRWGYAGVIEAGLGFFCKRCFVRVLPELCTSTSLGYDVAWV